MIIKSRAEIEKIRAAGKILARVAKAVLAQAEEGVKLKDLDNFAREMIKESGAKPAFLGYQPYGAAKPYPCSVCTSVNDIVVHGVPGNYKLKSGDLLKLDFGVNLDGWNADAAWTVGIGSVSKEAQKLIKVTQKSLFEGIKHAKAGKYMGDVGWAINRSVSRGGFKVVQGLTGHGIGEKVHEEPSVFNEGQKGSGIKLESGMVLAIEPMASAGSAYIKQLKDDSFATQDGSLSAHFEHTVAITDRGPEILTII